MVKAYAVRKDRQWDNPKIIFIVATESLAKFIVEKYNRMEWDKLYTDQLRFWRQEFELGQADPSTLPEMLRYRVKDAKERAENLKNYLDKMDTFEKWLSQNRYPDWYYEEHTYFSNSVDIENYCDEQFPLEFKIYTDEELANA